MSNRDRVSVIIPSYNAARFLPEAIDSVRQQTLPADEIIVIDDGSIDDTENIVKSLGPDIIYIRQTNAGVSASRNKGIGIATGEYIAFLDADDRWLPQKLEHQTKVLVANPHVGLIATDRAEVNAKGDLLLASLFKKQGLYDVFENLHGSPVPNALSSLIRVNFIPTSSVLVRKSILEKVGVFDTTIRYGEDLELWARIALEYEIVCLPEVLIYYRRHNTNATKATEKLLLDMVRVMKNIRTLGAGVLEKEGVNADIIVAQHLWDLAYWYFTSTNPKRAYAPFLESFQEKPSFRTLVYMCLCLLPSHAIMIGRNIKNKIIG